MYKEIVLNNRPAVVKTASTLYVVKNELYVPDKNIIIPHSACDTVNLSEIHKGGYRK